MAKTADNGETAKRTRTPRPLSVVLIFDDFDGKNFHGLTAHRIDAGLIGLVTKAAMNGQKVVQVEIPPASSNE